MYQFAAVDWYDQSHCAGLLFRMRRLFLSLLLTTTPLQASEQLAQAALLRTKAEVTYDGAYRPIPYPDGDVPAHIGVCTDLVIRAYRSLGVDLQYLVHEDMREHFDRYPDHWGLTQPDSNIDHRRVPNLETFFARHGTTLAATQDARDYQPGDIVTWRLGGSLPHIGIVGEKRVPSTQRYYVVHNIGAGPRQEDVLFKYPLHAHFRFPGTDE